MTTYYTAGDLKSVARRNLKFSGDVEVCESHIRIRDFDMEAIKGKGNYVAYPKVDLEKNDHYVLHFILNPMLDTFAFHSFSQIVAPNSALPSVIFNPQVPIDEIKLTYLYDIFITKTPHRESKKYYDLLPGSNMNLEGDVKILG